MKKVFIVCGKNAKENYTFWISAVVNSKEKAELCVKELDLIAPETYHYYFEEPVR